MLRSMETPRRFCSQGRLYTLRPPISPPPSPAPLRAQAAAQSGAGPHSERRQRPRREKETAEGDLGVDGAPGLLEGLQRPQGTGNVQGGEEKPGGAQGHRAAGTRLLFPPLCAYWVSRDGTRHHPNLLF